MDTTILNRVEATLQEIEGADARVVTRVVLIYEVINTEGVKELRRYASTDMYDWDVAGFLGFEPQMEDEDEDQET